MEFLHVTYPEQRKFKTIRNSKQEVASSLKPRLYFLLINSLLSQKSRLNLICLHYE